MCEGYKSENIAALWETVLRLLSTSSANFNQALNCGLHNECENLNILKLNAAKDLKSGTIKENKFFDVK